MTHVVTCQGRDHRVNIRCGRHNLVIVLFTRIGLHIPVVWALFWAISTYVIRKKDDLMFGTKHSPMATRVRHAVFHSFFPYVLEIAQSDFTRETLQPKETYALCQGLIVFFFFFFKIYPWLKHVISMALLMSLRSSGRKLFRVTMLQYASSSRKLQSTTPEQTYSQLYVSTSIFGSILQQLRDDHRFSPDPFCALAEFEVLLHKAKKITKRELSKHTPDCIGAKLLITTTALRAYRNRHLGTIMRCCEAWKPIE